MLKFYRILKALLDQKSLIGIMKTKEPYRRNQCVLPVLKYVHSLGSIKDHEKQAEGNK